MKLAEYLDKDLIISDLSARTKSEVLAELVSSLSAKFPNLDPGQVTITESDVPAGWDLDDITCAGTTVSDRPTSVAITVLDAQSPAVAVSVYSIAPTAVIRTKLRIPPGSAAAAATYPMPGTRAPRSALDK